MDRSLILLILSNVALTSVAQIVLKAGMSAEPVARSFATGEKWTMVMATATNPLVLIGLAMYVAGAAVWLVVLSRMEVSLAYPFVGLGFVVTMVLGWQIHGDNLSASRLAGTLLIAGGVAMLARS